MKKNVLIILLLIGVVSGIGIAVLLGSSSSSSSSSDDDTTTGDDTTDDNGNGDGESSLSMEEWYDGFQDNLESYSSESGSNLVVGAYGNYTATTDEHDDSDPLGNQSYYMLQWYEENDEGEKYYSRIIRVYCVGNTHPAWNCSVIIDLMEVSVGWEDEGSTFDQVRQYPVDSHGEMDIQCYDIDDGTMQGMICYTCWNCTQSERLVFMSITIGKNYSLGEEYSKMWCLIDIDHIFHNVACH